MHQPLSGLRILTIEQNGAGPYGTQLLASLGADVIKIENPAAGGDSSRSAGPGLTPLLPPLAGHLQHAGPGPARAQPALAAGTARRAAVPVSPGSTATP